MTIKYRRLWFGLLFVFALGASLHYWFSKALRYEIPGEYKGWIMAQFENPDCSRLQAEGIFRVVSVPSSGRFCTSDPDPNHWTYYKFEYVYLDGTRKSLRWNDHGKPGTQVWLLGYRNKDKIQEIFVGDEEAMNHSGAPPSN